MAWPTATLSTAVSALRRPAASGAPQLSVVIVNYRQWDRTSDLVRQLLASACVRHGQAEVVIVDNHSPRQPALKRLRRLPHVSLRRWGRNRGFARAVNEGCRLSRGDWFLLLNPDITPSEGFLDSVAKLAQELAVTEPRAGIVGFHLRNSDGSPQLSSGPFPTLTSTLSRLLLPRHRRKYRALRGVERCRVPWVTGCCLLVRRACLEELGGLDEDYFLYYEDVDLCLRAHERGWTVLYEPKLTAIHHDPLHRRAVPGLLRLVTRHSLLTYAAKHWPAWQFQLLTAIVGVEARLRRLSAWWACDGPEASAFGQLATMTRALRRGDQTAAHDLIHDAVRLRDVRVGV